MVLEGKCFKSINTLRPMKLWNAKVDRDFAKHFTIKVEILALHIVVFHPKSCCLFLTRIVNDAPGLAGAKTSGINQGTIPKLKI